MRQREQKNKIKYSSLSLLCVYLTTGEIPIMSNYPLKLAIPWATKNPHNLTVLRVEANNKKLSYLVIFFPNYKPGNQWTNNMFRPEQVAL